MANFVRCPLQAEATSICCGFSHLQLPMTYDTASPSSLTTAAYCHLRLTCTFNCQGRGLSQLHILYTTYPGQKHDFQSSTSSARCSMPYSGRLSYTTQLHHVSSARRVYAIKDRLLQRSATFYSLIIRNANWYVVTGILKIQSQHMPGVIKPIPLSSCL